MNDEVKAILISTLLTFIGVFNYECIPITLPYMSVSLGISSIFANWVYLAFFLACSGTGLAFGKISRKYGIVRTSVICVVLGIIGSVLCLITLSPYFIIIGNMLHGVSAAGTFATLYVFIYRKVNIHKIGRGIGILTAGGFAGCLIGPIVGGFLSAYISWIWAYFFTFPLMVITLILLLTFDDEWIDELSLDKVGCVFWFVTMGLFIYSITYLATSLGEILFVISIILMVGFICYELKISNPLFNFKTLKNPLYGLNNFTALMIQFIKCGVVFVITLYLQYVNSFTAVDTGFIIGFFAFIMIILSLIVGKISDNYNPINLTNYGLIVMVISLVIFCFIRSISIYMIIFALILLAIGISLFETPNKKIVFGVEKSVDLADGSAFLSTLRDIGSLIPTAIFTFILTMFTGCSAYVYWSLSSELMFKFILVVTVITLIISLICKFKIKDVEIL